MFCVRVVRLVGVILAERILAVAEEHGVPVRRDPDLLQLLAVSQVGEEIPTEVYGAVAQLISFLWRLNDEGLDSPPTG